MSARNRSGVITFEREVGVGVEAKKGSFEEDEA
jgi:hypothetical protein